ncbi:hypothetical protein D3C75_1211200 [compost metagenome]
MNTNSDNINARAKNAVKPSHGACKCCLPWVTNSPSDAVPAGMPKPRKSRAVRVVIAPVRMNGR